MTTTDRTSLRSREAVFQARRVNERFRDRRAPHADSVFVALCECGRGGCRSGVELTVAEYDEIRQNSDWCIVVAGHETSSHGLVHSTDRYLLVTAHGTPAEPVGSRGSA